MGIYTDHTTLYSKCDQASDLWQQLELASDKSMIYKTLWTEVGRGFLISMLEKLNWFSLTSLITVVLLMWKWIMLFLRKIHLLRCWGWLSVLNWIGALTLSLLVKLPPRYLELWLVVWSFLLLRLLSISIRLLYCNVWTTVVISTVVIFELRLLVATWNCWIIYKNGYAGLLVLHLLHLLNPLLMAKMSPA